MKSAPQKREGVGFMTERGISQRRACQLLSLCRSRARYRSRGGPEDRELVERLRRIKDQWPRFGYRRAWAILRRAGQPETGGAALESARAVAQEAPGQEAAPPLDKGERAPEGAVPRPRLDL